MYLKKCQVKNFRSIKELDVYFEPNFQILVGLNESGKSNILKALSFLDLGTQPQNDDVSKVGWAEPTGLLRSARKDD